jgi:hypothetical protein
MLVWLPPYRVELRLYGKEFGDFAFLSGGNDFLVSEKFRHAYKRNGLAGLVGFDPVEVIRVKSRRRKRPQPPQYYRVQATYGDVALDVNASEIEWLEPPTCQVCWGANLIRWRRLVVDESTWHGQDAFRPRGMSGTTIVSARFHHVCQEHHITNAQFTPAELAGHDFYPGLKDASELDAFRTKG